MLLLTSFQRPKKPQTKWNLRKVYFSLYALSHGVVCFADSKLLKLVNRSLQSHWLFKNFNVEAVSGANP